MNCCETRELELSAWLDGELSRDAQLEAVDHLVRCTTCRRFWAEGRALDGLVSTAAAEPPSGVWARIQAESSETIRAASPSRAVPAWALRAAASLVLAIGLSLALIGSGGGDAGVTGPSAVRLGSGPMDQTRFVSLTRELLRADPVYHEAMHRVMDQVLRDTGAIEASNEGLGPRLDARGDDDTTPNDRGPA